MKFKPIKINELNSIYEEARYNDNTIGICANIINSVENIEKKDYSTLSLISIMHEKGILKHELINESFKDAQKIINSYEGIK